MASFVARGTRRGGRLRPRAGPRTSGRLTAAKCSSDYTWLHEPQYPLVALAYGWQANETQLDRDLHPGARSMGGTSMNRKFRAPVAYTSSMDRKSFS